MLYVKLGNSEQDFFQGIDTGYDKLYEYDLMTDAFKKALNAEGELHFPCPPDDGYIALRSSFQSWIELTSKKDQTFFY